MDNDGYDPFEAMKLSNNNSEKKIHAPKHSINAANIVHHLLYEALSNSSRIREAMVSMDQSIDNDLPYKLDEIVWALAKVLASMNKNIPEEDIFLTAKRFSYMIKSVTPNHSYWKA